MIESSVVGDEHLKRPFAIGHIDPAKGYVHVLDDTSLDVVMQYLDTISDFVAYLSKKERLLTSGIRIAAAGEEELLAQYVAKLNGDGEHDFVFPRNATAIGIGEGEWATFLQSEEHTAQVEANRISYAWDALIEQFLHHLMSGTQRESSGDISEQEKSFRWLARENRTRRRMLARAIHGLLDKTPSDWKASRITEPSRPGDPYFLFLLLPRYQSVEEEEYRRVRSELLRDYCLVLKLHFPDAQHIIGIATEPLDGNDYRSEDFVHLDATEWNEELNKLAQARKVQLGIFEDVKITAGREQEYPVEERNRRRFTVSRNSPCICGSGKRFKRCCGDGMCSRRKGRMFRRLRG
jgi:SEC-C motif